MLCDLYDSLIERLNSGLADCNSGLTWHEFKSPAEALPKASAAARKALEINPESAEAYAPLALAMSHRGDWTGAEADFDRLHERSHVPSSSGVQAGVPPEAWNPRFKRAGAELYDPHHAGKLTVLILGFLDGIPHLDSAPKTGGNEPNSLNKQIWQ